MCPAIRTQRDTAHLLGVSMYIVGACNIIYSIVRCGDRRTRFHTRRRLFYFVEIVILPDRWKSVLARQNT